MPVSARDHVQFLLNDKPIKLSNFTADLTLLDWLRLERRLTGTKEGCAEGDCGACTVLVGRLVDDQLTYESVNACIRFMASLDGCHIVTVEHLSPPNGKLHPVQQAMVDYHGSQCGFCTPGIVMSLYGLWLSDVKMTEASIEQALQGNLCRCTGYQPIIEAALQANTILARSENDPITRERDFILNTLEMMSDGDLITITHDQAPSFVVKTSDQLAELYAQYPNATLVAGSTDVGLWVTKHFANITPAIFINQVHDLMHIDVCEDNLSIGALVTYSDAHYAMMSHSPEMADFWPRIGGEQVRNMGTIGGNIANGSPIGDTPPPLIALGAKVTLRKGDTRREILLEDFFLSYGKQDRAAGEFVEYITIPKRETNSQFAVYKISKRRDEDISAVCGAFYLILNEQNCVADIKIAFGGMAGTPLRAKHTEQALIGKSWALETILAAQNSFEKDYQPLTDWRATKDYRMLVAKNLLKRFYLETSESTLADYPIVLTRYETTEGA